MSGTIAYGRALFYPYINFNNEKWLKTAALYYKGLDRIVPDASLAGESELIKALNEQEPFIRDINPEREAEGVANEFLRFAKAELVDKQHRETLIKELGLRVPSSNKFRR